MLKSNIKLCPAARVTETVKKKTFLKRMIAPERACAIVGGTIGCNCRTERLNAGRLEQATNGGGPMALKIVTEREYNRGILRTEEQENLVTDAFRRRFSRRMHFSSSYTVVTLPGYPRQSSYARRPHYLHFRAKASFQATGILFRNIEAVLI